MAKILIVEDHALVREAMAQTLCRLDLDVQCAEAADADQALELLDDSDDWDLVIVDLMLPGLNGFSFLGVLAKRFPDIPALVVSAQDDQLSVQRAMRAGASGFIPKSRSSEQLLKAVQTILDGGVVTPQDMGQNKSTKKASLDERFKLTAAQNRVVELLAQGKTNREIADLLELSEGTVKVHMSAILRALNVKNRAQALLLIAKHQRRKSTTSA